MSHDGHVTLESQALTKTYYSTDPPTKVINGIDLTLTQAAPRQKGAAIARVDALMERFGIAHVKEHGITQVSGGQLQRASICRALACEPSVMVYLRDGQLVSSRELGTWRHEQSAQREGHLFAWLRELGF